MKIIKILFTILCIVAVFAFPWQLAVLLAMLGLIIFDFREIILIAFVMDLVYGFPNHYYTRPAITVSALVIYILIDYIKEKVIRKR